MFKLRQPKNVFDIVLDIFEAYVMIASCLQNDIVRIINIYVCFKITNVPMPLGEHLIIVFNCNFPPLSY